MAARVPGVEPEHDALAKRPVGGRKPVEHRHQAVAAGGHRLRLALEVSLAGEPERRRPLRDLLAEEVEEPAQRPHPATHAMALVQVPVGDAREVRPEVGVGLPVLAPVHHRRDVGAEGDEHRRLVERAGAERLDRLVVRGRDHGQSGGDPGGRRGLGRHRAGDVARQLQFDEHLPGHVVLLEEHGIGTPLPGVGVDRPLQQDVVGGAVPELAGEAVGEVPRGGRRVGDRRVVGPVRLVGAIVHPADHGLPERAVGPEEGLAAADRAEADARDLGRVAVEAGERLAARGSDRVPQVVVGVDGDPVPRPAHGPQRLPALRDDRPRGVVDDDLGALGASVHADQVRAGHRALAPPPRPSGRGSRRPRRGRGR